MEASFPAVSVPAGFRLLSDASAAGFHLAERVSDGVLFFCIEHKGRVVQLVRARKATKEEEFKTAGAIEEGQLVMEPAESVLVEKL